MILESYLGSNFSIDFSQFDFLNENNNSQTQLNNRQQIQDTKNNNQPLDIITLDGDNFLADEKLLMMILTTKTQKLNYQMQGKLILNNQEIDLSYQLNLIRKIKLAKLINQGYGDNYSSIKY